MVVSSSKYVVQEHSRSLYEMKMTVTVKKFEKDDVGSYRCIAKNSLGEVGSRAFGSYVETIHSLSVFPYCRLIAVLGCMVSRLFDSI
jgi:hypothetical protein